MESKSNTKKLTWIAVTLMSFTSVWGFDNIMNGYGYYHDSSIFAWVIVFALYFIPYALMVGEMASILKSEGGVSSWINELLGPKFAYYASWTIWAVHLTYIAQKPQRAYIALGWLFYGNDSLSGDNVGESYDHILSSLSSGSMNNVFSSNPFLTTLLSQFIYLFIFTLTIFIASRGITAIKIAASSAGIASFTMSILFIIMIMAAPNITGVQLQPLNITSDSFSKLLSVNSLTSLSILVFAVGGCEKLSSYVNKTKNPSKDFSRSMIALAIMMSICAILGTIAVIRVFGAEGLSTEEATSNGSYKAFQALGTYYGVGNLFSRLYGLVVSIIQLSVIIMSIDAPLRMLIIPSNKEYIPEKLYKTNKFGVFINGYKIIYVAVFILIVIPIIGSANATVKHVNKLFIDLNSIVMPIRYLWVFLAYILLKRKIWKDSTFLKDRESGYTFTKRSIWGQIIGCWCFAITTVSCIFKIFEPIIKPGKIKNFSPNFVLTLNLLAPGILILLGMLMPIIRRREKNKV